MSIFSSADVATFQADRLLQAANSLAPDNKPSATFLLNQIQAAEAEVSHQLRVFLEPTRVFPIPPTSDMLATLESVSAGDEPGAAPNTPMPWVDDPANDYDPTFFRGDNWGYITLRRRPVVKVNTINFVYPAPGMSFYTVPSDWIRLDKRAAHIQLVPASAAFTAPLNAFLMAAMGGGMTIPYMIQVDYVAGLQNVRSDPRWADLVDVILKKAVLKVVEGWYLPQSSSISADGLSQSISVDCSKYRDLIDLTLFGPKGSNGGLFTAIHGLTLGVLGSLG